MTQAEAYATARTRARHQPQIVWRTNVGGYHTGPRDRETLKRALLAVGTNGRFTEISTPQAAGFAITWRAGLGMIRHARFGC